MGAAASFHTPVHASVPDGAEVRLAPDGCTLGRERAGGGLLAPGAAFILVCTAVYSCWCGTPLIWDGSYQFALTLVSGKPFVYGTRFHTWLLWQPLSWLAHYTTDLTALVMAYGLPFLLAPAAGFLLSWWFVRRHAPGLVVWAAFGVAIATLPGQVFVINDSIFQQHLFWPVFLGAMLPLSGPQQVVLLSVALMQLSHPIGMVLLAGAATSGAAVGLLHARRERRRELLVRAGLLALLAAAAALKLVLWKDIEAAREATWEMALVRWRQGVVGAPLDGLRWMWAAAVLVMARGVVLGCGTGAFKAVSGNVCSWRSGMVSPSPAPTQSKNSSPTALWAARLLAAAAFACVAAGALRWVPWAGDGYCIAAPQPHEGWARAIDYRRWIVPLTLPFFLLAFVEAGLRAVRERGAGRTGPLSRPDGRFRVPMCYLLSLVFASVLGLQSSVYRSQTRRLMQEVNANPHVLVSRQSMPWIEGSTLAHWGTGPLVAVMQGPRPSRLFIDEWMGDVPDLLDAKPPRVPLALTDDRPPAPGPGGWFDYRPFIRNWCAIRDGP